MFKQIGKYNVNYLGLIYDGKIPYELVIIEEFDGDISVEGIKKALYFRQNRINESKYIMPFMMTEADVEKWLQYRNNAKIQIYNKLVVEEI